MYYQITMKIYVTYEFLNLVKKIDKDCSSTGGFVNLEKYREFNLPFDSFLVRPSAFNFKKSRIETTFDTIYPDGVKLFLKYLVNNNYIAPSIDNNVVVYKMENMSEEYLSLLKRA